ncbi:MAG: peptidyl-tRNA hydrolase domain protein [Benniella sp.]|nr:MAG: peptidyl-tRNA hydrolase domain protein [Benniella sp.]
MPQPTDAQVHINESDVRVDVFRAPGSDSTIQLTHLPTGIIIAVQNERTVQKNRAKGFAILRARLDLEKEKLAREGWGSSKKQDISDTRPDRVRTYNYPQERATDHRIKKKALYTLEAVLKGESLLEFIQAVKIQKQTDTLMALNEDEP